MTPTVGLSQFGSVAADPAPGNQREVHIRRALADLDARSPKICRTVANRTATMTREGREVLP